jgi:hypothetical protein
VQRPQKVGASTNRYDQLSEHKPPNPTHPVSQGPRRVSLTVCHLSMATTIQGAHARCTHLAARHAATKASRRCSAASTCMWCVGVARGGNPGTNNARQKYNICTSHFRHPSDGPPYGCTPKGQQHPPLVIHPQANTLSPTIQPHTPHTTCGDSGQPRPTRPCGCLTHHTHRSCAQA